MRKEAHNDRHKRRELLRSVVLPTIGDASAKTQKAILRELAEYSEKDGTCFPSLRTLASDCGCGQRTVQRGLHALEQQNLIQRTKRTRTGNRGATSNVYSIHWEKLNAFVADQVASLASCSVSDQVAILTDQVAIVTRSSGQSGGGLENRSETRSRKIDASRSESSSSKVISFDPNFSFLATEAAKLLMAKNGTFTEGDWMNVCGAVHVGLQLVGEKAVAEWIKSASTKTTLLAGYFTRTAIKVTESFDASLGFNFDAMKREAPKIPFDASILRASDQQTKPRPVTANEWALECGTLEQTKRKFPGRPISDAVMSMIAEEHGAPKILSISGKAGA